METRPDTPATDSTQPHYQRQTLDHMKSQLSELERWVARKSPLADSAEAAGLRNAVHDTCMVLRREIGRLESDLSRLIELSGHHRGPSLAFETARHAAHAEGAGQRNSPVASGLNPALWPKA